jgi:predicted metal-dependent phosphoesterase TrpH
MMRVDLHVHTSPRSPCSSLIPQELIQEARRLNLDGICLTEHQVVWDPLEVAKLAQDGGIKIFRGNEFTTNQGDILVFGYEKDVRDLLTIQELYNEVKTVEGFMIAAHPFRGFKTFGIGQLQLTVEQACKRKLFNFVDAIEINNGRLSDEENEMARKVAVQLGLRGTAGSDAHKLDEVGKWVTDFEAEIQNEEELVEELRAGRFTIVNDVRDRHGLLCPF